MTSQIFAGEVYYVDATNGNDSNNGLSKDTAWKTIAKINNSSFNPSDFILLKRGKIWREVLRPLSSGRVGSPITFGAYGTGENPIINGATIETGWTLWSGSIYYKDFANEPRVVVEDELLLEFIPWDTDIETTSASMSAGTFTVDVANNRTYVLCSDINDPDSHTMEVSAEGGEYDKHGIYLFNRSYVTFENITICNTTDRAIIIHSNYDVDVSNVVIQNCNVYNAGEDGIVISNWANSDGDHPILDCLIENNIVSYSRRHGILITTDVRNTRIRNNTSHHNGWGGVDAPTGGHGISLYTRSPTAPPMNNIIEFNEACYTYETTNGGEGTGIQCDGNSKSNIVRYNISHDNEGNGFTNNHNLGNSFYYNISFNNSRHGMEFRDTYNGGTATAYNNVIYNNAQHGMYFPGTSTGTMIVKNNIIFENGNREINVLDGPHNNFVSNYNCIYHSAGVSFMKWRGTNYDWTNWTANSAQDINSLNSNPLFINADNGKFNLQFTSLCIDSGTNVNLNKDYEGNKVPTGLGVDIGAFEYQGSLDPLTVTINASATSGYIPLSVDFTNEASGGASPYSFSWDFGDRSNSSEENPSHTYSNTGQYNVTLTVTDSQNNQASDSLIITASEPSSLLSVSASASPTSGQVPLTVNFTSSASGGTSPYSYSWNFGDGGTSSEQNPSHTYSSGGNFNVSLTVTDANNSQASDSLPITVSSNPSYNLAITAITGSPSPGKGGSTDPSSGNHTYSMGSSVQIKAIPNADYRFSKWKGDVKRSDAYDSEITITMDNNKDVSAYFFTKCGDVNGDLSISPADAQAAFDIFLGRISNPTEAEKENADVNCDGTGTEPSVTPADAQVIFDKFIGKNELPCDCSCKSRTSTTSIRIGTATNVNLIISDVKGKEGEDIVVSVLLESPLIIRAFGFDILYPSEALEFVGVEHTEFSKDYIQLDANKIAQGVVRAGGYKDSSVENAPSRVLIKLVFRVIGEMKEPGSFTIINMVDDIKNVSYRNGMPMKTAKKSRLIY